MSDNLNFFTDSNAEPCIISQLNSMTKKFRTVEIEGICTPKHLLRPGIQFHMVAPSLELKDEGAFRFVNTSEIAEIEIMGNKAIFITENGSTYSVQYQK